MIASFLMALALLQQPEVHTSTVAGQVVEAGTNAPLARVRVLMTPALTRPGAQTRSVVTGSDGRFGFLNVVDGKYTLAAELPGRLVQMYLGDGSQYSTAIVTGAGQDTEHIVFPYHKGGAISGSVVDENGEPLRPQVHLYRKAVVDGRERLVQAGISNNAQSRFRFAHLLPGDYYLAVMAQPWFRNNYVHTFPESNLSKDIDVAYPITYYPGTTDFAGARAITVTDGSAADLQISMRAVPAIHISAPRPVTSNAASDQNKDLGVSVTTLAPDGSQEGSFGFSGGSMNFAPGTYVITLVNGNSYRSKKIVRVESDLTIDAASAPPPISVSGKIVVNGPLRPRGKIIVSLITERQSQGTAVNDDGTFSFKDNAPFPGRYRLALPNNPNFFISSIAATGATVAEGVVELKDDSNAQLTLTLSPRSEAKVEGVVTREGKPLAGAMVLLVPAKNTEVDLLSRDQSDLDGSFTMNGVVPGQYRLLAIDKGQNLPYRDPAALRPYLPKAKTVEVTAGISGLSVEAQPRVTQ